MECLSIIVGKIAGYAIEPVVRQVGYVINLKSNVENLESQLEKLVAAKERVRHSVDDAKRKGYKIEADVNNWLKTVDKMIAEANELLKDENQLKKNKCLFEFCPSLISSRYRPSRKATKLAQKVVEIQKGGDFTSGVSYTTPLKDIWISSVGYQAFESRSSIVTQIMKELTDSNIHMIGVYGMPGVGKTTLVKEIARRAEEEKLFDNVAKVEVRQNTDLNRIQKEIAEKFALGLEENLTVAGRARLLTDYIMKNKNILVILDDVWEEFDLESLGVPFGICKLLLTSRDRDILSSKMGTQKEFQLKVLEENETWSLFENIVGEDAVKDPDIRSVAIEVAKRCAGLPVLVVTVAKALKGKRLYSWKDALRSLEKCDGKGMLEKAYSGIEWCYNQLEGKEVQSLFLLLRMIGGRNIFLKDVLKYTVGLGLFEGVNTIQAADDRLHSLVDVLKDSCLLMPVPNTMRFAMHDLVRDVAMSIASKEHKPFLSLAYEEEFKEWPNKESLEKCAVISLDNVSNIPNFPEKLECPKLQLFFMFGNNKSLQISHNFFKEMKELKVLDLTRFRILTLPLSIHFLNNLQTLCLDGCELGDIAIVGNLRSLEILSFINSKLKQLPKEIGQLTKLRLLDLDSCTELEVIYPNVISSLTCLEELTITEDFNQWEIEGNGTRERSNASLSELKHLSHLITLGVHMEDASQLPIDCFSEKLVNFNISIGDVWNRLGNNITSRRLKIKLSHTNQLDQDLQTLMKKSEALHLDVLEGVTDTVDQLDVDGFPRLKRLRVQNNAEILQIVNCWSSSHIAFPILEELFLHNLVSLGSLCSGQLPRGSFEHLTTIEVQKCPKLKNLFSFSTFLHLLQLQKIKVVDCNNMKEIVVDEKEENFEARVNDHIEFFQLRSLILQSLPEFTCFASNNNEIVSGMGLFNHKEQVAFPKLVENLTSLIVDGCAGLSFLSSSSIAKNFVQLKKLRICRCQNMVEIISTEEHNGIEEKMDNMFPKLESLELDTLAYLETFCSSATYLKFSCLNSLHIKDCTKLGPFILDRVGKNIRDAAEHYLFDEKVGFPSLEKLVIRGLHKLKTIWHTQLDPNSLCEVKIVTCKRLKNVFPASVARNTNLGKLHRLWIQNCKSLEEIVGEEVGVEIEAIMPKFVFPSAKEVYLFNLPQLSSFYPGMHTSKWPSLIQLAVRGCDKLEILAAESYQLGIPTYKQVFFLYEKVSFSNLCALMLDIKETSSLPVDFFKIKTLYFGCRYLTSAVPLSDLFQKCHNLETLLVRNGNIKEIFIHDGSLEGKQHLGWTLTHLKTLKIVGMTNLKHVWKDNSHLAGPVFPNLETLRVWNCPGLKNIVSSAISFRNIVELEVVHCHGMEHLITYSVAKSFINLEKMTVKNCQRMIEIVASDDDDDDGDIIDVEINEITFSRLEYLELSGLPNLKGFCSRHYNVTFPFYITLSVSSCLEIKISPDGVLLDDFQTRKISTNCNNRRRRRRR